MTSINMGSFSETSNASMNNDNTRDRFSELADNILVHILSFLPILDAVRTVLLRRFGNLWTLITSLDINDSNFLTANNWPKYDSDSDFLKSNNWFQDYIRYDDEITGLEFFRFTNFVRNVLKLHKRIPVDKFLLRLYDMDVCDDDGELKMTDINYRVRFVIDKQVKELCVEFEFDVCVTYMLHHVFKSEFLVKLKLVHCEIEWISRVQMRSLRKLSLTYVKVSNEMFEKIIFGSPSLQELVLRYVYDLNKLRLTAPNIVKLELESYDLSVLDCPNLKILNIHLSCRAGSYIRVVNIPSVREVRIQSINQFDRIVNIICKVEVLKFSEKAFQQSNLKELEIPQTRWRSLHIESQLDEDQLIGVCRVLRSSPHLEELIVFSTSRGKNNGKTNDHHVLSKEPCSLCVIPQLKNVTIRGHKLPSPGLLQLAEYLLQSCVNLENMVILPSTYKLVAVEELKLKKQLLSFPRASANSKVLYGSEVF